VHRIGRTGRAGREGTALTFVGEWDLDAWEQIKAEVGAEVTEGELGLYRPA
jgi:superfamily II DNA/RNA helicase